MYGLHLLKPPHMDDTAIVSLGDRRGHLARAEVTCPRWRLSEHFPSAPEAPTQRGGGSRKACSGQMGRHRKGLANERNWETAVTAAISRDSLPGRREADPFSR